MKKLIQYVEIFVILFAVLGIAAPKLTTAQAVRVLQRKDMKGQTVRTTYIRYADFKDLSSITNKSITQESSSGTTSGFSSGQVPLRELLSVSSLDEAIRILGEPKTIDRDEFSDGGWATTLRYEGGTMFDYRKFEDGEIALIEFELWRSNRALEIGEMELCPGMNIDGLSPAVRQSISEGSYPEGANVDGIGAIQIATPGSTKGEKVEFLQGGKAQITVHVNREKGTVEVLRFTRLGPW